jgi:acyl carrier protein
VKSISEDTNIVVVVRNFIVQKFPLARRRNITDDDNLLETGVIDSLGVLEIVTFLREEFSLEVEDDELTPENFQSISSIAGFVGQRIRLQQEIVK